MLTCRSYKVIISYIGRKNHFRPVFDDLVLILKLNFQNRFKNSMGG